LDWIKNIRYDLADKVHGDCILFLWAVNPQLKEAIDVMESWGFKYKTVAFCWIKQTSNGNPVANLGRWTMGGMELCLLGTRGKPQRFKKNIKQLIFAERTRHSEKPAEVRDRILEVMRDVPRLELFARQKTEGWDVRGNEVESDIELSDAS
jgi:N6-adenosine-specific RNA methylase IME4